MKFPIFDGRLNKLEIQLACKLFYPPGHARLDPQCRLHLPLTLRLLPKPFNPTKGQRPLNLEHLELADTLP
ncbi:MAG: hypothetical protein Q8O37_02120 [Sulfuricellaceae bacterium]|nr:hypothetical protein [Sulfuricellaceae bacterium]